VEPGAIALEVTPLAPADSAALLGIEDFNAGVSLKLSAPAPDPPAGMLIADSVSELMPHEVNLVQEFRNIVAENRGSTTPYEKLLVNLVHQREFGNHTPEMLLADVEEFRSDFEALMSDIAHTARRYPSLKLGDHRSSAE
jgi:hypothetical protein